MIYYLTDGKHNDLNLTKDLISIDLISCCFIENSAGMRIRYRPIGGDTDKLIQNIIITEHWFEGTIPFFVKKASDKLSVNMYKIQIFFHETLQ